MAVEAPSFAGFTPAAIQFLADLARNNDRAWFAPRKGEYERLLKEPLAALCTALAERFAARGIPLQADPARSPFRIYRDTRFSKDKSPYKTHLGATFPWVEATGGAGEAADAGAHGNGGYFNFQPGEMYAGGGMWMAEKPRLDALRRAIVESPDRVQAAIEEPAFVAWFGGVRTHDRSSGSRRAIPRIIPWRTCSAGRTSSSGGTCRTPRSARPTCPTCLPTATRPRFPCSASSPPSAERSRGTSTSRTPRPTMVDREREPRERGFDQWWWRYGQSCGSTRSSIASESWRSAATTTTATTATSTTSITSVDPRR